MITGQTLLYCINDSFCLNIKAGQIYTFGTFTKGNYFSLIERPDNYYSPDRFIVVDHINISELKNLL